MNFTQHAIQGHTICHVQYDAADLAIARTQAAAKAPFTNVHNPAALRRTPTQVMNSQLLGTLADLACFNLVQRYFRDQHSALIAERYDDVRTDNFRNPHPYCIRILNPDRTTLSDIEVRSSVCNRVGLQRMLQIWHVLGWYETAVRPADNPILDFYMRPIYHFNRHAQEDYSVENVERYIADGALDLYIVGGTSRDQLQRDGETQPGYGLLQDRATYRVIQILRAMDVPAFLNAVLTRRP
jgi:hypothetical protein